MTSPLGIVLVGAGRGRRHRRRRSASRRPSGSAAVAWGGRVARAVPEATRRAERIDPFVLSEPWRRYVQSSQTAQARFERTVQAHADGPIERPPGGHRHRLDEGVADVLADRRPGRRHRRRPAHARRRGGTGRAGRGSIRSPPARHRRRVVTSLEAQLASAQRMQAVSQDARDRLRLLDARLDELVARAVEVSVGSGRRPRRTVRRRRRCRDRARGAPPRARGDRRPTGRLPRPTAGGPRPADRIERRARPVATSRSRPAPRSPG